MVARPATPAAERRAQIDGLGRDLGPALISASMRISAEALPQDLSAGVRVRRDERYGDHERHVLDVYSADPESAEEPSAGSARPVVVYVHGGGFAMGSKGGEGTPFYSNIGAWAVHSGYVAVVLNYRLTPEASWPSGAVDIAGALGWVAEHIADFGGSAERVFLAGQSAGSMHVADYLAHPELHAPGIPPLAGAMIVSCIYDLSQAEDKAIHRAYWGEDVAGWAEKSSLPALVDSELPLFLSVSEFDEPQFQQQAAGLVSAWFEQRGEYAPMRYLYGQNHLTSVYAIGTADDSLGPLWKQFIDGTA